ncbi:MAG: hypothetical protein EXR20_07395 [Bacteroidetes bacterium]|nr:hypothetical protein [Bacteroidota bacterium]
MKAIRQLFIVFSLSVFSFGCKMDVPGNLIESNSFIRTFPLSGSQSGSYIHQTDDGGYLILGHSQPNRDMAGNQSIVLKLDKFGNTELLTSLDDSMRFPSVIKLKDGNFLGLSSLLGAFWKFDDNGNLLFNKRIQLYNSIFSTPIEGEDGNYYLSYARGGHGYANYLQSYSPSGDLLKSIIVPWATANYRTVRLNLFAIEKVNTFFFIGDVWINNNFGGNTFLLKLKIDNTAIVSSQVKLIDSICDNIASRFVVNNADHTTAVLIDQKDKKTAINSGLLLSVDSNLNVLWKLKLIVQNSDTKINSLIKAQDGSYIASGYCILTDKMQAFACKISKDGQIEWTRIYTSTYSGMFNHGQQLKDGSFVFVGNTVSFGFGKDESDIFMIKTDNNGQLK